MASDRGNTIIAILAGAAIGAALGILFAPDKGSNTRGKIKDGFDDKKDELKNKFGELSEKVKSKFAATKADLESSFDDLVANVDEHTDDVIVTLENKLAELKKTAEATKNRK
ncbi:YtxH domain-containing protein [Flavobacterium magnum]|uniref:YtxH domain-containing protein n=1 Tax=Flavobacterium magnum TaxID=2162713 RepID=A0A2S0RIC1_9FLAO|nr:YtxH domain-containing protein [Flavobacterium magnum]AWA31375.1 YtxH domain-containing protein [Flavobacterium magnum]